MNSYEHLRIEYLLTKTLIDYQQNNEATSEDNDGEVQRKLREIKEARKLVDEMLSKAKLKELALNKAEASLSKTASNGRSAMNTRTRTGTYANDNDVLDNENRAEFEKLKRIRDQVEAIEEKYELSKEAMKKLLDSGPGLADILGGTVFNDNNSEDNDGLVEDEDAEESEKMRTLRVYNIHRANVQKANLLIRCYAQLPYSMEPHLGSAEMKRIRAVVDAVLSATYEVNLD